LSAAFYVRYLNGYNLELENSLEMIGSGFKSFQLPSPKTGGYFELTKNLADVFENFVNGTTVGAPKLVYQLVVSPLLISTAIDYFNYLMI
jgi:hypothetical protein